MSAAGTSLGLTASGLFALKFCLLLILLFYIPYLAFITGGTAASLIFNDLGRGKGGDLHRKIAGNLAKGVLMKRGHRFVLGIVPLFPLAIIYKEIVYREGLLPPSYWWSLAAVLFTGILLLSLYGGTLHFEKRNFYFSQLTGTGGLLLIVTGVFFLLIGTGYVISPEKWPFIPKRIILYISWSSLVTFLTFFSLAGGVVGIFMIFLPSFIPSEGDEERYSEFLHRTGAYVTIGSTLLLPPLTVLELVTLPGIARSGESYLLSSGLLLLAFALCAYLVISLEEKRKEVMVRGAIIFGLLLVLFSISGHVARQNALRENSALIVRKGEEAPVAGKEGIKEGKGVAPLSPEERGEKVFSKICMGCHRLETKLVGPPLLEVLPEYRDDVEKLKAFVRNPVKENPDYPPMPKLGLTEEEIDGVAHYLLKKLDRGK